MYSKADDDLKACRGLDVKIEDGKLHSTSVRTRLEYSMNVLKIYLLNDFKLRRVPLTNE
jgi:hypothetical protein